MKHRTREQKNNKKVARKEGYPEETSDKPKNPKPTKLRRQQNKDT